MCAKLHTVVANNNRVHLTRSLYYCLFAPYIYGVVLCTHSVYGELRISAQRQRSGRNNIPSFSQQTAPITRSLCEGWTWRDLHILVTAPFYCDRKARATCVQSFTLWQQATIEFTWRDHYIIACSRHIYMVLFFTHILFVVNCVFQRNASRVVAAASFTAEVATWPTSRVSRNHSWYSKRAYKASITKTSFP